MEHGKILHLNSPTNVQIEVTEDCNHKCFYCYNHWREDDASKKKLSFQLAKDLMNIILNEIKPFEVVITGGEPLKNMPAVLQIAKMLRGRNYSINTNLTLMNESHLDKILSANPRVGVLTSLPHHKQELFQKFTQNKRLDRFYQGLELVMSKNIPVTVNMVVHKYNKNDLRDEAKFLTENYGVKNFCATPVLKPSFRESNYHLDQDETNRILEDLIGIRDEFGLKVGVLEVLLPCSLPEKLRGFSEFKRGCTAGRTAMQIAYNGEVRACGHSPFVSGNLFEDGFQKIWENFSPYRENELIPDECNDCSEVYNCGGGCRFEGLKEGEPKNRRDSRMTSKISEKRSPEKVIVIDIDKRYSFDSFLYRKESDDV